MHLKTIKTAKEAGIEGVEFTMVDKAIVEVRIGKLHIRKGESYAKALEVVLEQPFEEEPRHRLTATVEGFDPKISYHGSSREASEAAAKFTANATTEIAEVSVLIDENGEVVGEVGADTPTDDMPF